MTWPSGRAADGGIDAVPLSAPPLTEAVPGSLWLCGKRVVAPDPAAALDRVGADTIVCFQEVAEVEREHPDYAQWLRANEGGRAIWVPVPDLGAPTLDVALEVTADLTGRLGRGDGLVLHCAGGIGRAPTMATLVLIALGADRLAAAAHVAAHRPMAGPEAGCQADLVRAFARR